MAQQHPSDEELMAFADGAMAPAKAAAIARLVARDAVLAARVEMYRQSLRLVREAARPLAAEPVPDALRRSIKAMIARTQTPHGSAAGDPATVVHLHDPTAASIWARPWSLPLAAALAAVVAGLGGYAAGLSGDRPEAGFAAVGAPLTGQIAEVLISAPSGADMTIGQNRLRLIATLRGRGGELCREFEVDDTAAGGTMVGLACRNDGTWRLDIAVAAPQTADGFAPASSLSAIDAYLAVIEAGEPLSASEEKAALDARS